MNRTFRAFKATMLFAGFGYAAQALSLIAIPLYLRSIGAEGYGLMVITMSFMGYLNFADAGLSWGSMILIGQADGRNDRMLIGKIVRSSMVLAACSGLIALMILCGLLVCSYMGFRLPMFSGHPEADRLLAIAGVQLVVTLQAGVFYNLFQGLQEAYWTAFYQGLSRIVAILTMMSAAWFGRTVWLVLAAQLLVTSIFAIVSAIHAGRRHAWAFRGGPWIDMEQLTLQITTGLKMFILQVGRTVTATAPVMVLSSVLGPASVPVYTLPLSLLQLVFMPLNSWSTSLQIAYGEAWESGNRQWVINAFRNTVERGLFWGAFGSALFVPLAIPFISLWTNGRLVLPALAPMTVVVVCFLAWFQQAGEYLLSGLNLQRKAAIAELFCGALAIPFSALSVRWLGLSGIALGMSVAAFCTALPIIVGEIRVHVGQDAFPSLWKAGRVGFIFVVTGVPSSLLGSVFVGGDLMHHLFSMAGIIAVTAMTFSVLSLLMRLKFIPEAGHILSARFLGGNA